MPWTNKINYTQLVQLLGPIAGWPQAEASGTTIIDESGNGSNGVYTAVTLGATGIGDGRTSARYNGTTSIGNVQGVSFAAAFNGQECSVLIWPKVSASGVWSDATNREMCRFLADGSNFVILRKTTTTGQIGLFYTAGGTAKSALESSVSDLNFMPIVATISKTADTMRLWRNGIISATTTTLGTFAGTPTASLIGTGSGVWSGDEAHCWVWARALTAAEVSIVSNRNGQVLFAGDSRTGTNVTPTYSLLAMANASVTPLAYGASTWGVSGATVADLITSAPTVIDPLYTSVLGKNIVVIWGGVNDAAAGASAATIWSRLQTYCLARRAAGFKVILCTEIDCQSAALDLVSWHTVLWPALLTLIRAGWASVADGLADTGANANLQDATNATYFNADKVHLTATGYGVVAGIVAAQVAIV